MAKQYDPIITMRPYGNSKLIIDICDGSVDRTLVMPRLYNASEDYKIAIKDFVANLRFIRSVGWRPPEKRPGFEWRENKLHLEVLST
jgi:hypothetical protein